MLFPLSIEMYPETAERFLYRRSGSFIPGIVGRLFSFWTLDSSSQAFSISSVGVFLRMGLHWFVVEDTGDSRLRCRRGEGFRAGVFISGRELASREVGLFSESSSCSVSDSSSLSSSPMTT